MKRERTLDGKLSFVLTCLVLMFDSCVTVWHSTNSKRDEVFGPVAGAPKPSRRKVSRFQGFPELARRHLWPHEPRNNARNVNALKEDRSSILQLFKRHDFSFSYNSTNVFAFILNELDPGCVTLFKKLN